MFRQKFAIPNPSDRFEGSYSCWSHRSKIGLGKRPEIFPISNCREGVDRTQALECRRGNTMPSSVDHHIFLMRANYIPHDFYGKFQFQTIMFILMLDLLLTPQLAWCYFFQGCWGEVVSYKKIRFGDVHLSPWTLSLLQHVETSRPRRRQKMWLLSLHGQRLMLFSEDWKGWIDAGLFLKACMKFDLFMTHVLEDAPSCSLCRSPIS